MDEQELIFLAKTSLPHMVTTPWDRVQSGWNGKCKSEVYSVLGPDPRLTGLKTIYLGKYPIAQSYNVDVAIKMAHKIIGELLEKPYKERLETRIENLRWVVIILIIIVSLLSIYVIFQLISLSPILSAFGFIVILCLFLLYKECAKMRVAPPPGFEPGS